MKTKVNSFFRLLPILSLSLLLMATCFATKARAETLPQQTSINLANNQLAYYRVYYAHPHWRYAPRTRIYRAPGYYRHPVVCKKRCFYNRRGALRCVRRCY